MTKTLILLRGLPGAGKSTVAQLFGDVPHMEADQYFVDANGNYEFKPELIREAHDWCKGTTHNLLRCGSPMVVVSNTFTMEWEMEDYMAMAKEYDYRVVTLIVENRHGSENIHGCPPEKVEIMRERFQIQL
jgi:predicted kinase